MRRDDVYDKYFDIFVSSKVSLKILIWKSSTFLKPDVVYKTNFYSILEDFTLIVAPMSDDDARKFIVTPRFKDQIAKLTNEDQWKELGLCLSFMIRQITITRINNYQTETYDKCYAILTKLMEKSGHNDWLFIKDCYKNVKDSSLIIREIEVMINQYHQGLVITFIF